MFIQVIQGQVSDAVKLKEALDEWLRDVSPEAEGWLGSTGGVTEDGRFIALVRFSSEEAARRNSERPEQDAWFSRTSALFTDEASFLESNDVILDIVGDPDQAGFVQVMQGRGTNPERAWELMTENSDEWADFRPEILGTVGAQHEGGAYTMAIFFTSEEAAREGERKEPPPALQAQMEELQTMNLGEPEFFDLKDPWLNSPN